MRFFMTAGQVSDYTGAAALLGCLPKAEWLIADRASISVGDGMQFGVHAAPGPADQTAPLAVRSPFFDCRLLAVRCALR